MMLLDGKKVSEEKLNILKEKVLKLKNKPSLVIVQVGNDTASNIYIKQKEKVALYLGYKIEIKKYNEDIKEDDLVLEIEKLNNDKDIDGIIVEMPLPKHINSFNIINKISVNKDVDGLTNSNIGLLVQNKSSFLSCTPKGIMDLLEFYNINVEKKNVVILGRSILVGKPLSLMMINKNATVTVCHTKTENLIDITKKADILIVAIGKPKFITKDYIKKDATIIDVGINRVDGKIIGDVDFESVKDKVSYITPVPNGVGPMTVYELMENVYISHINNEEL